jgi:capsular polysaccharide biosynthesis protein
MSEHISNNHCAEDDVIDLRELVEVIRKRKKIIFLITGIITALAVVYAFWIAKPVYEIKSMIEVGQIDNKPIDDIKDIKQKLSYEYKVNARGVKHTYPLVKAINIPKGSKSILSLVVHAKTNNEGIQYIEKLIQNIETEYKEKTDAYISSQKELIELVKSDIRENSKILQQMREELKNYKDKIISLKSEDAALAGIYALQIGQKQTDLLNLQKYISELKNKEQELKLSITPLMIRPTHMIGEVETLQSPVKPKKKLIIIVSFITGLILSIFLVFLLEFFAKGKE